MYQSRQTAKNVKVGKDIHQYTEAMDADQHLEDVEVSGSIQQKSRIHQQARKIATSRNEAEPFTSQLVRNQVFISYSHKDRKWLEKLQIMLKPLIREKKISIWDDTQIKAGTEWRKEISKALARARVAVLLVSPDFLASDFIAEHELLPSLDAAKDGGLIVLWVAIRDSMYKETGIERYQAANDPSKPLADLRSAARDRELVKISEQIKLAVESHSEEKKT